MKKLLCAFLLLSQGFALAGPLKIFACEPEWAELTRELSGDKASVFSATTSQQDPHRIEARPALIAKVRGADLVVCTGLELETGWLPLLLQNAANPKVRPGRPGYFEAGAFVQPLDVDPQADRGSGDVHAQGNPHIQLDPRNIQRVADALHQRLAQLDSDHAAFYQARHQDFTARWQAAIKRWQAKAEPLRNVSVVSHHKDMVYLTRWLGMKELGYLEPKPGLEPSTGHLSSLLNTLRRTPAKMVLRTPYQSARPSQWLASHAKIPAVVVPFTVGGDNSKNLFELFDLTLDRLLEAAR